MKEELIVSFSSEVIYWRGPSPFYFLKVPIRDVSSIKEIANLVTYGWGVIPCDVTVASTEFYTALIPKDGTYLVPLKKIVRQDLGIDDGDVVKAVIRIVHG